MTRFVSAVLCALFVTPVFACARPSAPTSIPDGASASKEEMLTAKRAVDAFKISMEEYLACEKSGAKKDGATAELLKVAARFNAQVKAYKAKS